MNFDTTRPAGLATSRLKNEGKIGGQRGNPVPEDAQGNSAQQAVQNALQNAPASQEGAVAQEKKKSKSEKSHVVRTKSEKRVPHDRLKTEQFSDEIKLMTPGSPAVASPKADRTKSARPSPLKFLARQTSTSNVKSPKVKSPKKAKSPKAKGSKPLASQAHAEVGLSQVDREKKAQFRANLTSPQYGTDLALLKLLFRPEGADLLEAWRDHASKGIGDRAALEFVVDCESYRRFLAREADAAPGGDIVDFGSVRRRILEALEPPGGAAHARVNFDDSGNQLLNALKADDEVQLQGALGNAVQTMCGLNDEEGESLIAPLRLKFFLSLKD